MKRKIAGIFVCMLLMSALFPIVTSTAYDQSILSKPLCGPCDLPPEKTPIQQLQDRHATGFVPPLMDLSHLTGQEMPDGFVGETPPTSFDWRTLGMVTPVYPPGQGNCGSCYAFAALGCFESKILIHGGGTYDLSEDNVKECEWYHSCCSGGSFKKVASFLSQRGTVLEACDPYQPICNSDPPCRSCTLQQTLLDWRVIAEDNIPITTVLKNYIYNEGPVYAAMWVGSGSWCDEFNDYDGSYTLYYPWSGSTDHAVLIVGWDDSLTHAGGTGGWICKNSWGTNWGGTCGYGTEKGYFTIAYGSAAIGKYSSYVDQWGKNTDVLSQMTDCLHWDEGGWNYNWGYSSNTAWGLVKFINPFMQFKITRVEFWTTDVTTDIDVYIYDDFDGTTLSNLMWSSLDHSFSEAGYHGVAVFPPLSWGDPVYVAVKFTNKNYQYPVASDQNGPTEISFTYTSPDGSHGSWFDRGTGTPKCDVAIRLRISNDNPPNNPTITGPITGNTGNSYPYSFTSIDPENDKVSYYIKWGDGEETDWTAFQTSGSSCSESHTWTSQGTYTIEAKTRDIYGVESGWGTLTVTMPRNKAINRPFLNFLQNHPNLFPILQLLLQRLGL